MMAAAACAGDDGGDWGQPAQRLPRATVAAGGRMVAANGDKAGVRQE
jgi:hypothetical protein